MSAFHLRSDMYCVVKLYSLTHSQQYQCGSLHLKTTGLMFKLKALVAAHIQNDDKIINCTDGQSITFCE